MESNPHMFLTCTHCHFVAENAQQLSDHCLEHNQLSSRVTEAEPKSPCAVESQRPVSSRTRKLKTKSFNSSNVPGDGDKEQPEKILQVIKRQRRELDRDSPPTVDNSSLQSKEYVAEDAEHIYRTHTCPTCNRCFKMRSHLQEHLHLHFPDPTLQCATCKRYFTSKSKLRVHRLREAGEKLHRCHLCNYSAVERNAVQRHFVSMHADAAQDGLNSQSYPCPTCGQSFHQSRSLKAHMKTHNIPATSKLMACFQEACSFQTSSSKELLRHSLEVHGVKSVECRHHACGAVFPNNTDMEIHYQTHLAYHCLQCDFSCSNKAVFLQHQRHGHAGCDELCCDFCSFVTFNPLEFEQHVGRLHAIEKIHRCSQCSYVTSHKRGLKRHMLMHSGEKPHKCRLCDFRCRDESYLSKHMLIHSDDKNFMCAECGYVTKWKHYLNVHMRKHAGDLRYHCDQCSYRCHRMDQLNSHKLRHQAKSLMCEICAYACKRKYELRNHMLAKHSGENTQASVYQCKYCTYTTSYRQALQNHENCKHTRLKEFHCALCSYSSFSSVSLFLHKRKAHGYIPGDKTWLENYAAKEQERNSTEFMEEFYNKCTSTDEQPKESTGGVPASEREQPGRPGAAGCSKDTEAESQSVESVNNFDTEAGNDSISESPPTVNSPEEYCTLILTTLSTTDYQCTPPQNTGEDGVSQKKSSSSDTCQGTADISSSTSSSEEDNVMLSNEECDINDVDEPAGDTASYSVEPRKSQTPQVDSDAETVPEPNQPLQSEVCLKALKKHDKDQAEAMVLEGRVQMLLVPNNDVFRCKHCSYKTFTKAAFKSHCQALCREKIKEHKCQACGAQFKQRRGLNSHLAKKCTALQRRLRTLRSSSEPFPGKADSSAQGNEAEMNEPNQTEPSLQNLLSSDSDNLEIHQQVVSEGLDGAPSPAKLQHRQDTTQKTNLVKVKVVTKALYTDRDGKFKCPLCTFSSLRLSTVERHLTACQKKDCKGKSQILSEMDQEKESNENNSVDQRKLNISSALGKRGSMKKESSDAAPKALHCHMCAFICKQTRRMAQHISLIHKGVRPHRCRYCPFATLRRYRLEQHESLHTGVGRHKCDVCSKTFGAAVKLRQHKMRIHDKQPTHFCPLCDFSGYTLDDIQRHKLRCHTGEMKHVCTDCDSCFSSEVALRNHCKRVHQPQVCIPCKSCKPCDHTCGSEDALKAHQQNKHCKLKCPTCQKYFATKESLESPQKTHLPHQCQVCPFATKTRRLLVQHLMSEHEDSPTEDRPLKCSMCAFTCRHQLVLENHLRSHGGRRLYKCRDCKYSTRNKQKITWHIRTHTGEKPYSCDRCTYTCTDPSRLKIHMRVHQDEKKYLCPTCGYKCKWATQLKYHMTKHTGEKPYACDECDYRTNRADALRAHRDTQHSDLRPYICEKCGKAFKTSFILKTHQQQHSDGRPYTCGLCHKSFRWPAGLRHHYLSHTKQQPFSCRHCSYRAKQRFQVVKHLQRHHPEMSVNEGVVKHTEAPSLTLQEALQGTLYDKTTEVEGEGKDIQEAAEAVHTECGKID